MIPCAWSTELTLAALTMRCLVSAMDRQRSSGGKALKGKLKAGEITPDVFAVVLELCNSDTIATQKSAMQLASIVVSGEAGQLLTFEQVERAATVAAAKGERERESNGRRTCGLLMVCTVGRSSSAAPEQQSPWDVLVHKGLSSDDVDCAHFALQTINSIAQLSGSADRFLALLDQDCGLLRAIGERCLHVASFRDALVVQQRARLQRLEDDRTTNFDPAKTEHVALLKEMWGFVFPDDAYPGDKGTHWEQLGFQGKDPATDLRGAGLMGLKVMRAFFVVVCCLLICVVARTCTTWPSATLTCCAKFAPSKLESLSKVGSKECVFLSLF